MAVNSKKKLVVVDMQNDFIDGSLGSKEAQAIVDNVVNVIKNWEGEIIVTMDTHYSDYLNTREGKYLPVEHCIHETNGWQLNKGVQKALKGKNVITINKHTFGSVDIYRYFSEDDDVLMVGLCTDICVVSNALLLKAHRTEMNITVDASCCAGVTPDSHKAALTTMKMCQINIINND